MSEVLAAGGAARDETANERYYLASQWQLIRRKFARHKLAKAGLVVLAVLYVVSMFAEFFATQDIAKRDTATSTRRRSASASSVNRVFRRVRSSTRYAWRWTG